MTDVHAHVLPGIDDGSQNISESIEMLRASYRQGISRLVATPHFYADRDSPQTFLERRAKAWMRLSPHLTSDMPGILLGAEVHFFEGVSRTKEILALRAEGTSMLLLEMPFTRWSSRMLSEVFRLNESPDIQVVIAHIERYLFCQPREILDTLIRRGVLIQANAEYFLRGMESRRAFKLLDRGKIHLLGSDCHNMDSRPPRLGQAAQAIQQRLGEERLCYLETMGQALTEGGAWSG